MIEPTNALEDPYGLLDPEIFDNPYPTYHILRHADPVHWSEPLQAWVVTRYMDVSMALSDRRFATGLRRRVATERLSQDLRQRMMPIDQFIRHWLMNIDPPEHTRRRAPLNRIFSKVNLDKLRPQIITVTNNLIDSMLAIGGGDLIADLAQPLPVCIIAALVGIPKSDHPKLLVWFAKMSEYFEKGPARVSVLHQMTNAINEMNEYFDFLIDLRLKETSTDLISQLLMLENMDDELSRDHMRSMLALILFAGHESTRATIGNGMLALLQYPQAMKRLRAEPALLGNAIEEMLRYDGPFMRVDRIVVDPGKMNESQLERNQRIIFVLGAANRDPAKFHNPDAFDIMRTDIDHLSFGHSEHFCLGARLARMELLICFELLIKRLPIITISAPGIAWRQHFNHRGLKSMPISFT